MFTKVLLKRDLAWPFSHPAVFALQLTSLYMYISTVFADNGAMFPKEYLCFEFYGLAFQEFVMMSKAQIYIFFALYRRHDICNGWTPPFVAELLVTSQRNIVLSQNYCH